MSIIFKHISSGALYKILLETNVGSTKPSFIHTAVYQSLETGQYYSRPMSEFLLKFEKVEKVVIKSLPLGTVFPMPAEGSPLISPNTPVRLLSLFTFNNSKDIFLTVEDTVNCNYNFKGQPEKIIVTFKWL